MTPATGLDITTNTNEAYNLVTRGGGEGGGEGGGGRERGGEGGGGRERGGEGGGGGRRGIQLRSAFSQQVGRSHKKEYEVPARRPLQSSQGLRVATTVAGAASGGGGGGEGGTAEEEVVYELIPGDK